MKLDCKDCGLHLHIGIKYNPRKVLKVLKEHMILAKLFGCKSCMAKIFYQIMKIKEV